MDDSFRFGFPQAWADLSSCQRIFDIAHVFDIIAFVELACEYR
jgi:hypothetical protein